MKRRPQRFLALVVLMCPPFLSTLLPTVSKPPHAVVAHAADESDDVATYNVQGIWGTATVGGRFGSRADSAGVLSLTIRGRGSSSISVPLPGELVTYQRIPAVIPVRTLEIACHSPSGRNGPSLENISLTWTGPRGMAGRLKDSVVAWTSPQGVPGLCYQGLLLLGVLASYCPALGGAGRPGPWIWWIGAAALVTVFPGSFSPLTRLVMPGGVSLATLVLGGAVAALVSAVARGHAGPRWAVVSLLVWASIARLTTLPLLRGRVPGDIDEIVYEGVSENIVRGRGFVLPSQAYRDRAARIGDPVRDAWFAHELYLGIARKGHPTAAVPPLYPLLLAGLKSVGLRDLRWVYGLHMLFGLAATALAGSIAWRMGGAPAGVAAMALAAFHSPAVAVTGFLFTEPTFVLLMTAACALLLRDRPRPQLAACALAGLAALTRPVALAAAPLWPLYMGLTTKGRARWTAVAGCVVLVLTQLPWALRNQAIFGAPAVGSTFAGKDFFMGNNDTARRSGAPPSDWFSLSSRHRRLLRLAGYDPVEVATMYEFPVETPSEVARDRALKRKAALFILVYPAEFVSLTGQRLQEFVGLHPRPEPWEHVGQLPFLFFPALALLTAAWGSRKARHGWLLMGVAVMVSMAPLASVAYARYRLPVDFALFPPAGTGLAALLARLSRVKTHAP